MNFINEEERGLKVAKITLTNYVTIRYDENNSAFGDYTALPDVKIWFQGKAVPLPEFRKWLEENYGKDVTATGIDVTIDSDREAGLEVYAIVAILAKEKQVLGLLVEEPVRE